MNIDNLTTAIIILLVGIAVFITGMTLMSDGLKKSCGKGIKNLFKKIQNNNVAGLGIGLAATAIIQSSAATSIMTIGFISAGVMTIAQGICIILGAYIGTTVTGVLVSLSSSAFSISIYFMIFAFIGVFMMFFKKEKIKNIGQIFCGLGILFFGLESMKGAFGYSEINAFFIDVFSKISFPLLLVLIGAVITAIVQSSSATSGIVIVMLGQHTLDFSSAMFLLLGAAIGTVLPTVLSTAGGTTNSKRTALMCVLIRSAAVILGIAIIWPLQTPISNFFTNNFASYELGLAMFYVIFNAVTMLAFLPFAKKLESLSKILIKEKQKDTAKVLKFIDKNMINSPSVAAMQVKREIQNMLQLSSDNYVLGFRKIVYGDSSNDKVLLNTEESIDAINFEITNFLISISNRVTMDDEKAIGSYFHVINDIERIGDHAYNFYETANKMAMNDLKFSKTATAGLEQMNDVIVKMFELAKELFENPSQESLKKLHDLEDQTDDLKIKLSEEHYERIRNNKCTMELTPFYSTLVSELERVADHLTNIGYSQVNPTGSEN